MSRLFLFLLLSMGIVFGLEAGFSNSGRVESRRLNLQVGQTLDNNGELVGIESATISCGTLTGKGLIQSPEIQLSAGVFAYTGVIDCSGTCKIRVGQSFNERMFKRKGGGKFIIQVDPTLLDAPKTAFGNLDFYVDGDLNLSTP